VLGNQDVEVTNANIGSLSQLSDEFRFWSICAALGVFQGILMEEAEVRQSQTSAFTFQRKSGEWQ
jgi:hypothetical protein